MPHICTRCNNVFESGEDILKGCPVCGWKKFMFVANQAQQKEDQPEKEQIITRAMGVRVPPQRRPKVEKDPEKTIPPAAQPPISRPAIRPVPQPVAGDQGSDAESNRLESVKITAPGTYELNLPSLFERDELIMAVKEGTYFIDLSSAFRKKKD